MKNKTHILSYPRSGNHLMRTFLEYQFRVPTVGSVNSATDLSIAEKTKFMNHKIINAKPKFYKAHFIKEVLLREKKYEQDNWGLIFLLRHPFDAISSHVARSKAYNSFLKNKFDRMQVLENNIEFYLNLIDFYQRYPREAVCVLFDDMIEGKEVLLTEKIKINFNNEKLNITARKSQSSLAQKYAHNKQIILQELQKSVYSDVLTEKYYDCKS